MARSRQRRTGLGLLVVALALVAAVAPVTARAQEPRPPAGSTLSGEVTDANPLKVNVNGQEYLLQTSGSVVVNRGGKEVKLAEVTKGDKVTFTTNADSSVQRIDVTDAATDARPWLLIGLLVLAALAVAAIMWYMSRRRRYDTAGADHRPLSSHR